VDPGAGRRIGCDRGRRHLAAHCAGAAGDDVPGACEGPLRPARHRAWYEEKILPRIGPFALYGLLFTIVILFALQGQAITGHPGDVARIALPLLAYFALMWSGSYLLGALVGLDYPRATTLAFTAAGNNFELAIAVAIATFGVTSGQALAGVVGPLMEVPVLVALVHVSLAVRHRWPHPPPIPPAGGAIS
jgi:ACR3 family arsenite transporter